MEYQYFHPSSAQSTHSCEYDPVNISAHSQGRFQAQFANELYPYNDTDQQRDAMTTHSGSSCSQQMGMAVFSMEKSDEQIRIELAGLYSTLQRAERYQRYREKQPILTPAEVIERDAEDKKERERREAENLSQNPKDSTVWPDFLEYAFWKALVRWPPMGRRKCMLEGVLKGRNELIQDSIYRDTGIVRDRKQISSHLQVLKAHLKDYPIALAYMGITEDSPRRLRGSVTYQLDCSSHLHSPQHAQGTFSTAEGGGVASSHTWPHIDGAYTGSALGTGSYTMHTSSECVPSSEHFAAPFSLGFQASMQPDPDFDAPAYQGFTDQAASGVNFQNLTSLNHQGWIDEGATVSQEGFPVPRTADTDFHGPEQVACYSTRPGLQHSSLVTHLENTAEQYQAYASDENHGQIMRSQAAFHGNCQEQAGQARGLTECRVFGSQRDFNSVWDPRDVHYSS